MDTDPNVPLQLQLDQRQIAQVLHARYYAAHFADAGAPGHGQFLLIAKLSMLLDHARAHNKTTAALSPTTSIDDAMRAIEDIAELVGWPCIDSDRADDNFQMQFKLGGL